MTADGRRALAGAVATAAPSLERELAASEVGLNAAPESSSTKPPEFGLLMSSVGRRIGIDVGVAIRSE